MSSIADIFRTRTLVEYWYINQSFHYIGGILIDWYIIQTDTPLPRREVYCRGIHVRVEVFCSTILTKVRISGFRVVFFIRYVMAYQRWYDWHRYCEVYKTMLPPTHTFVNIRTLSWEDLYCLIMCAKFSTFFIDISDCLKHGKTYIQKNILNIYTLDIIIKTF